jgi:hypothetical protein
MQLSRSRQDARAPLSESPQIGPAGPPRVVLVFHAPQRFANDFARIVVAAGLHLLANVASKPIGNRDVHLVHGSPLRFQSFSFQSCLRNPLMSIFDIFNLHPGGPVPGELLFRPRFLTIPRPAYHSSMRNFRVEENTVCFRLALAESKIVAAVSGSEKPIQTESLRKILSHTHSNRLSFLTTRQRAFPPPSSCLVDGSFALAFLGRVRVHDPVFSFALGRNNLALKRIVDLVSCSLPSFISDH